MTKCTIGPHPQQDCGLIEIDSDPTAKPSRIEIRKAGKLIVDLDLKEFVSYLVLAKAHFDLVKP